MYDALARFYDRLDQGVDRVRWADWIDRLVRTYACGISGADLACGTGTLTEQLSRRLRIVCACDQSPEMLNFAANRVRVPLVRAKLERFEPPRPMDFLNIANDGVNYLLPEERGQAFSHLFRKLRPGGALLFDISSPYKLKTVLANQLFFQEDEGHSMFWQNECDGTRVEMTLDFFERERDGRYRRTEEHQIQYVHDPGEVECDLRAAGFSRVFQFGMYRTEPPSPEEERIQFVAVREKG